jgi:hypothetical protein
MSNQKKRRAEEERHKGLLSKKIRLLDCQQTSVGLHGFTQENKLKN